MKTSESFFRKERTALALSVLAVIAIPALNGLGIVSDNNLNLLGRYFCFALAALGIDIIWGYTGILSLCQALFFCLGGYCIGMHMLLKTGTQSVYGSALPDFMVDPTLNVVRVLPEVTGPTTEAYFVYAEELRHSKRISVFRDFLVRKVAESKF